MFYLQQNVGKDVIELAIAQLDGILSRKALIQKTAKKLQTQQYEKNFVVLVLKGRKN